MAYTWRLQGTMTAEPLLGVTSGIPALTIPLDETYQLDKVLPSQYTLADSTVTDVSLGGLTAINLVWIKVVGSKVRVRITSSDGSTQAIPVDTIFMLESQSIDITAIDLTLLLGGVETTVEVFLGQA